MYIGNAPYQGMITGGNVQDQSLDTVDIKDGAVTPSKLSVGHPTWDSSGNLTIVGLTVTNPINGNIAWTSVTGKPTTVSSFTNDSGYLTSINSSMISTALGFTPQSAANVSAAVAALVNSAPAALDTLNELAAALGNDANFATTITNALATKANSSDMTTALALKANSSDMTTALATKLNLSGGTLTGYITFANNTSVGIHNVDNTAWLHLDDFYGNIHLRNSGGEFYADAINHYLRNADGTNTWLTVDASQALHSSSIRAPLFYDSNNTAYYVDPTSTSRLADAIYGQGSSLVIGQYGGVTRGYLYNDSGGFGFLHHAGGWALRIPQGTGYVVASESMRSPIFYDENDTSCYADPNGYSFLHYLGLRYWKANLDRAWDGYPSITVYNDGTYGPQGEFRIHGYPGASGGDYSITVRADAGFTTGSDIRRKINIETISNALNTVLQLRGTKFNIINRDGELDPYQKGKQLGLIAQECKDLIPEAVTFDSTVDTPNENGWASAYSIDYASLTALLIEAIKEQQAQIDALKSIVENLK